MSVTPYRPYFLAGLYPGLVGQAPRFIVKTGWHVQSPSPDRLRPQPFPSLLVLDDLFVSVLPYTFHSDHAISFSPLRLPVGSWDGIPCDFGTATMWILSTDERHTLPIRLLVRLPRCIANPEPNYPLIGSQFLRHYIPRLGLDYPAFPWRGVAAPTTQVGCMEWD